MWQIVNQKQFLLEFENIKKFFFCMETLVFVSRAHSVHLVKQFQADIIF